MRSACIILIAVGLLGCRAGGEPVWTTINGPVDETAFAAAKRDCADIALRRLDGDDYDKTVDVAAADDAGRSRVFTAIVPDNAPSRGERYQDLFDRCLAEKGFRRAE